MAHYLLRKFELDTHSNVRTNEQVARIAYPARVNHLNNIIRLNPKVIASV